MGGHSGGAKSRQRPIRDIMRSAMRKPNLRRVGAILNEVRRLANAYRAETGKPLGVTAEIAEFEAARLLGLELAEARQPGYDAVRLHGPGPRRLQIKGRCILDASKPGQRVGSIKLDKEWDAVLLVLLNEMFEPTAIYEANRAAIVGALTAPGSVARNQRGALAISKFKSIAKQVWP